jgi:hypothetical protein
LNIQAAAQPRFAGYFKIGKNHDDQDIHDLLQAKRPPDVVYSTARSPEDQLVIRVHKNYNDEAIIDICNKAKPRAIQYEHQATPFLTPEQIKIQAELDNQKLKDFNLATAEIRTANANYLKAQALLMKEKRKTVLGFIKGCFTTNI